MYYFSSMPRYFDIALYIHEWVSEDLIYLLFTKKVKVPKSE